MECSNEHFDLVTLSYKLTLDIFPLDLHAKIQVRMSVCSAVRAVTDTQCQNYYTHHIGDVGCKNLSYKSIPTFFH